MAINALKEFDFTENQKGSNEQIEIKDYAQRFFDIKVIIIIEYVSEGQTIIQKYYIEVLIKFRERLKKKRPDLWKNNL